MVNLEKAARVSLLLLVLGGGLTSIFLARIIVNIMSVDNGLDTFVPTDLEQWPYNPRCYYDDVDDTISCENGIWRIRPTKIGIVWFDFFHPVEQKWYVNKNNLNLLTLVEGDTEWQNTELNNVQPTVEVVSEGGEELHIRYHFAFDNEARTYLDVFMRRASPYMKFIVHKKPDSASIIGFQWHVTFGQAEAVSRLYFDQHSIFVNSLPQPFPGSRLEVQYRKFYANLQNLEYKFSGKETQEPDPNNPWWMSRILGVKQHVIWGNQMRSNDRFAFEARDQPWQPDWSIPATTPWIEGLWFIRIGFLEADELTYGIENLEDYLTEEQAEKFNETDLLPFHIVRNLSPCSSFTYSGNSIVGAEISFTDTSFDSEGTLTYHSWNFGDGQISTAENPNHRYENPGFYNVTLTVKDNEGLENSYSTIITIIQDYSMYYFIAGITAAITAVMLFIVFKRKKKNHY